jgi:hypothetical protein
VVGHVERRHVDIVIRKVYQIEEFKSEEVDEDLEKTIREHIRKDLEVNKFDPNMIYMA